ncbi:Gfo/Idh/MocA family oxidoreductase [Micromonospora sp. NPDC049559]|uniref:Gfo/Idh/MocA family protein n=1 Tax=Micromonospora sp. NPDC049559 TaxID=3155923 RepID=UPI00341F4295
MTVRIGIIGAGVMGTDHARLLAGVVSGAALTAVNDLDQRRAAAVAESAGSARVLADPIELINDDTVDAVVVASTDPTHERFVLASIDAGKPVLCEKPLAPTIEACLRILDAEVAYGRRLVTVGFMRRYDPGYVELKTILDSGGIGSALVLHCIHRNVSTIPGLYSGDVITNSAVHEIDLARWLLDDEIVAASVHKPRPSRAGGGTQDTQILILESAKGVLVDIEVFVNARYGYDVRCELVGEEGCASLDSPPAIELRWAAAASRGLPGDWRPRFAEAYRRELQDWVDGLRGDLASDGADGWDGYSATAIAHACVIALETNARQEVKLVAKPDLYDRTASDGDYRTRPAGRPARSEPMFGPTPRVELDLGPRSRSTDALTGNSDGSFSG